MAERFRVLVTDFLDETTVEEPILGDIADLVLARAHTEADLAPYLADADALIVYHDIPFLGEAPGVLRVIGGAVTLVGVYLAIREEIRRSARRPPPPAPPPRAQERGALVN